MNDIPIIDISPSRDSTKLTHQVEDACRKIGFMYIRGHGIDSEIITTMRETVVRYFSQPLQKKLNDRISRDNYRGYIPAGFFSPNSGKGTADCYEGYKLHFEVSANDPICAECDLYGPNKWPKKPSGFKKAVLNYWVACDGVSNRLLQIFAQILSIDCEQFTQLFDKPLTNMTLLHYPLAEEGVSGFGIHPHKDTDALTILAPDKTGGLMVQQRGENEWCEVDAPDDALVVNIGDMLELWSGGYFVSTPHKVVNRSGSERYSFPYFAVPRFDTVIDSLIESRPGFERQGIHVGDISREVWRTNWPDTMPRKPNHDLGTLAD